MRRVAVECQVPFLATVEAAQVAVKAIAAKRRVGGRFEVQSLQGYAAAAASAKSGTPSLRVQEA